MSLQVSKRKKLIDKHLEAEAELKAAALVHKDEVEKEKELKAKKS
jgi:hypothetical protein